MSFFFFHVILHYKHKALHERSRDSTIRSITPYTFTQFQLRVPALPNPPLVPSAATRGAAHLDSTQAFLYTFKLQKLQVKQVQNKLNFTTKCLLFAQLLYAKPPNKHLRQEHSVNKHLIFQMISQVTDVEQSCPSSSVFLWVSLLLLSSFPLKPL